MSGSRFLSILVTSSCRQQHQYSNFSPCYATENCLLPIDTDTIEKTRNERANSTRYRENTEKARKSTACSNLIDVSRWTFDSAEVTCFIGISIKMLIVLFDYDCAIRGKFRGFCWGFEYEKFRCEFMFWSCHMSLNFDN